MHSACRDPLPRLAQDALLQIRDRTIGIRTDVQQEIAAFGHRFDEHGDDLACVEVIVVALGAVPAERVAEPAAQLPRSIGNVARARRIHR